MVNNFYNILFGHVLGFANSMKDTFSHYQSTDLDNNVKDRLSKYQTTKVLVIFDRYDDTSAKDYERIRCASEEAVDYNMFSLLSTLATI